MTIEQITKEVNHSKPVSRRQIVRYLRNFEIKPLGRIRQRPQIYPDDSAKRIIEELGLNIVSMPRLRRERSKAKKARAA